MPCMCIACGCAVVGALLQADVFLVEDVGDLCRRTRLAVTLLGGLVVTPQAVMNLSGPAVFFKPALATRRKVWASGDFQRESPTLFNMLQLLAKPPWSLIDSEEEFRRAKKRWPKAVVLGLVPTDQLKATRNHWVLGKGKCWWCWCVRRTASTHCWCEAWRGTDHMYDFDGFMQLVQKIDATKVVTGI